MGWLWQNKCLRDAPDGYAGFVYIITNLTTGKMYIGKKLFTRAGYKQVKKKRRKIRRPSDWKDYWGSNDLVHKDIKALGKRQFKREIIRLCKTKSECTYYETKAIFDYDALLRDTFYNFWVSCKITKVHTNAFKIKD